MEDIENNASTPGNALVVTQKARHRVTMGASISTHEHTAGRLESTLPHSTSCLDIHSSIIHNSLKKKKAETTDGWIRNTQLVQTREYP